MISQVRILNLNGVVEGGYRVRESEIRNEIECLDMENGCFVLLVGEKLMRL